MKQVTMRFSSSILCNMIANGDIQNFAIYNEVRNFLNEEDCLEWIVDMRGNDLFLVEEDVDGDEIFWSIDKIEENHMGSYTVQMSC